MGNKAVFLDRDGTINIEKHYLYKIKDFEFLPGAVAGLKLLQQNGYCLVIVTNQSGIGRGYYSESDYNILTTWMLQELEDKGVHISKTYYCPHLPDAPVKKYRKKCLCRKPAVGMYEKAIRELDIDIRKSWAVGDKMRDCAICKKTACRGFLIGTNEGRDVIAKVKQGAFRNIRYAADLYESAQMIVSEGKKE